jgi:hypothetical protein
VAIPTVWPRGHEAIITLQHAAAILRQTGDRHGEGVALNNLGVALRDFPWSPLDAITLHEEAVAIFRETATGTPKAAH